MDELVDVRVPAQSSSALADSSPQDQVENVDPRNSLNALTGTEWLQETKSFFFQKGLGNRHPHADIERQHPAPFSFQDVQRLVAFFTKPGETVLDPFSGVGSTAKACALLGRHAVGIELSKHWSSLAELRIEREVGVGQSRFHEFVTGDSREILKHRVADSVDFIVTSPPYWSILNKKADHKASERVIQNLATRYSDQPDDLGNIETYSDFLAELVGVFVECGRVLRPKGYMTVIVSDFRHQSQFHSFHSDLIQRLDQANLAPNHRLTLQGVKVLLQNHKSLKPYGYPFAYVENIHHQYILIFRKETRGGPR